MSSISCSDLQASLSRTFLCKKHVNDVLKLTTPITFPCGDAIDVFIALDDDEYTISDFGACIQYLEMPMLTSLSKGKLATISERCISEGLTFIGREISAKTKEPIKIAAFAIAIAVAIVRFVEMSPRVNLKENQFLDKVKSMLSESGIVFTKELGFQAHSGMTRNFDFSFSRGIHRGLIKCLPAIGNMRVLSDQIVSSFVDVTKTPQYSDYSRVVLVDDSTRKLENKYAKSMSHVADKVFRWSQKQKADTYFKSFSFSKLEGG